MLESARSRLRRGAVVVVAALALALPVAPAAAQELAPEQLALARQYVDLTNTGAVFESSMVTTGIDTMRTLVAQNPGMTEPVNTAIEKVLETFRGRKDELLDQFARVYALRFTSDELREIIAFYSSDTGQKLAKSNMAVNADLQRVIQVFESNVRPEFFAKVRAELKAAGINM